MHQNRPIHFYVANLGSEIQRVLGWKEKGDKEAMQNAYDRAISIIDRIKSFDNKSANVEMDILHKYLENFISENREAVLSCDQVSSYFRPFALRVTNNL